MKVLDFFVIETDKESLSRKGGSNSTRSFSIIIRDMTTSTEKFLQQKRTMTRQFRKQPQYIMCPSVSVYEYISESVSVCDDVYTLYVYRSPQGSFQFKKPL